MNSWKSVCVQSIIMHVSEANCTCENKQGSHVLQLQYQGWFHPKNYL